ncbi:MULTISPECIES: hypothetical protein [Enterobacter cloacae complex]|uniref:Uncharacterized protein n=1 Tax=Enterobacter genomosp. O TaxID=2364150 RepID=A0A0X4ELW8_9ENTR|nr:MULTISPECIES: hypothetical protein [Enterobacter cloacae complex]KUQ82692.1 hypothetical protein AWI28_00305 [Enterobacter genomosp. O]MCM7109870.1 hypothetical protein [Enterobacter cloacae]
MLKISWVKYTLLLLALLLVFYGVYITVNLELSRGTVIIVAGFGLIILTQFDWGEIKVLGLEAKLRNTINDAETVLESLRNIALPISEISISLAARTGRWDSSTPRNELYSLVNSVSFELKKIGVDESNIDKIKKDWYYYTAFDMCNALAKNALEKLNSHRSILNNNYNKWVGGKPVSDIEKQSELLDPVKKADLEIKKIRSIFEEKDFSKSHHSIQEIIDSSVTLTPDEKAQFWSENQDLWNELVYFINNKKLCRPEFWLNYPK